MSESDRSLRQEAEPAGGASLTYTLLLVTTKGETPWKTFSAGCLRDACERHSFEWDLRKFAAPIVLVAPDGLRYSCADSRLIASGSIRSAGSDGQDQSQEQARGAEGAY